MYRQRNGKNQFQVTGTMLDLGPPRPTDDESDINTIDLIADVVSRLPEVGCTASLAPRFLAVYVVAHLPRFLPWVPRRFCLGYCLSWNLGKALVWVWRASTKTGFCIARALSVRHQHGMD